MKKLILILSYTFFSGLGAAVWAEDTVFLHPIFYQQLSERNGDYFYVLRPNSIYYENSKTEITKSIKCILQENQEFFIKMLCNDCGDPECLSNSSKIHTFSLFRNKMANSDYIISHKVFDQNNSAEYEEILTNDGLITIPPYQ